MARNPYSSRKAWQDALPEPDPEEDGTQRDLEREAADDKLKIEREDDRAEN